jgi:D-3-phosphoglycerate dehydrogenase
VKKILVVQPLHPEALALFDERPDVVYDVVTDVSEANLLGHAPEADVITIRDAPLPSAVIDAAPRLKAISRHGVGYDNIPVAHCTRRGIPVTVVGPVNANAVAEQTLFLMLACARCGVMLDAAMRKGDFAIRGRVTGLELKGRTLLLVGYGRIGRIVGERAHALGMRVAAFDPFLAAGLDAWATRVGSLDEGLALADVLSLHVPMTPMTRRMIGPRELALLPERAMVINASRGGLIDEEALLSALRAGRLHGAGLDVFETEPLPASSPLLSEPRIVVSPHAAALTDESLLAMGMMTVKNALAALDGTLDPELVVNRDVLNGGTHAL